MKEKGVTASVMDGSMSAPILFLIILIEGFITLSAEILTLRQLLPVVGNSVIVTSLIIGVFLLFLAYGYREGGKYRSQYAEILKRNFTIVGILFGVGLSYSVNMDATVRSVFPQCIIIPVKYSPEINNVLYFCRKTENATKLYNDDLNRSTLDHFKSIAKGAQKGKI